MCLVVLRTATCILMPSDTVRAAQTRRELFEQTSGRQAVHSTPTNPCTADMQMAVRSVQCCSVAERLPYTSLPPAASPGGLLLAIATPCLAARCKLAAVLCSRCTALQQWCWTAQCVQGLTVQMLSPCIPDQTVSNHLQPSRCQGLLPPARCLSLPSDQSVS